MHDPAADERLEALVVAAAETRVARRRAAVPALTYPPELPVTARRDDLLAAIRDHQVVIVAGETGSGKTTQLPKLCLELGRGVRGADRPHPAPPAGGPGGGRADRARSSVSSSAGRSATPSASATARPTRRSSASSPTASSSPRSSATGVLLRYDTIIVDEAHERSLNIDFLLGYLGRLFPRRPDLKLIIASATIDAERFSRHFGGAPVVEVSGRTYPVEVRYRPLSAGSRRAERPARTPPTATAGGERPDRGDRRRRRGAPARRPGRRPRLPERRAGDPRHGRGSDRSARAEGRGPAAVCPPLPRRAAPRLRAAPRPAGRPRDERRRDLADRPGNRFGRRPRNGSDQSLQRPPEGPAPADRGDLQGVGRPAQGPLRADLGRDLHPPLLRAGLRRAAGLHRAGDPPHEPRVRAPPDGLARPRRGRGLRLHRPAGPPPGPRRDQPARGARRVRPQAADPRRRLTALGRRLARLPVDPRFGRMVIEADRLHCADEVIVIAAALSIQEVRERPAEQREAADAQHALRADPGSDFLSYLKLWNHLRDQRDALSGSQFRKRCRAEFLHYLRVREWQDLVSQLRQAARSAGVALNEAPADPQPGPSRPAQRAALADRHAQRRPPRLRRRAGCPLRDLSRVGPRPPRAVVGDGRRARRDEPALGPDGRRIAPDWVEALAGPLLKRTYDDPHWEKRRGAVVATERATLYGLPIVAARKVSYHRIDPAFSREQFIRRALIDGDWDSRHDFLAHNSGLIAEVEELEHRVRRRDILVSDGVLFDFYDARIPADVVSAAHFDRWFSRQRGPARHSLDFTRELLVGPDGGDALDPRARPEHWRAGDRVFGADLPLRAGGRGRRGQRRHPAGRARRPGARRLRLARPGPARGARDRPDPVAARRTSAGRWSPSRRSRPRSSPTSSRATDRLTRRRRRRARAPPGGSRPPAGLGHRPAAGAPADDVSRPRRARRAARPRTPTSKRLRDGLRPRLLAALAQATLGLERHGMRSAEFGTLPRAVALPGSGDAVRAYPSLIDEGDGVGVLALETEAGPTVGDARRHPTPAAPDGPLAGAGGRAEPERTGDVDAWPAPPTAALRGGPRRRDRRGDRQPGRRRPAARRGTRPTSRSCATGWQPAWSGATTAILDRVVAILAAANRRPRPARAPLGRHSLAPARIDVATQLGSLVYPGFARARPGPGGSRTSSATSRRASAGSNGCPTGGPRTPTGCA